MRIEHFLTSYRKVNARWLKDLHIRHNSIKLQEETKGKTFCSINRTNVFLAQSPKAIEIKTKINKCDIIKLISFCTAKEIINKIKRQPTEWEEILANDVINKGLMSKIYKQLKHFNNQKKKKNNQKASRIPKQTFLQRRHTGGQ